MMPAPSPVAVAAAAGITDADDPATQLIDRSSAHRVVEVVTPSRSVVVKMAGAADRGLIAETFTYRMAGWLPQLAEVLPPVLLVDEQRHVLVLEAIGDHPEPDGGAVRALGALLAQVHLATTGLPLRPSASAGVLHLPHADPASTGLQRAEPLVRRIAADDVLAAGLAGAAELWRADCLIHGDVKWGNVRSVPGGLRLIDWELSGAGDPMWDLACFLAGDPQRAAHDAVALVEGYGRIDAERLARYLPARMVHVALELAEVGADGAAEQMLDAARDLFEHRGPGDSILGPWMARPTA